MYQKSYTFSHYKVIDSALKTLQDVFPKFRESFGKVHRNFSCKSYLIIYPNKK